MTTIQLQLPDDLAENAQAAGLLTPRAIEAMLREQLRKQAREALRDPHAGVPEVHKTRRPVCHHACPTYPA